MTMTFYDLEGMPFSMDDHAKLMECTKNKVIEQTTLHDGKWISTVWLGIDHNIGGPPHIFETMVFPKKGEWGELDCNRYSTKEAAIKGHKDMVEKWRNVEEVNYDQA